MAMEMRKEFEVQVMEWIRIYMWRSITCQESDACFLFDLADIGDQDRVYLARPRGHGVMLLLLAVYSQGASDGVVFLSGLAFSRE